MVEVNGSLYSNNQYDDQSNGYTTPVRNDQYATRRHIEVFSKISGIEFIRHAVGTAMVYPLFSPFEVKIGL